MNHFRKILSSFHQKPYKSFVGSVNFVWSVHIGYSNILRDINNSFLEKIDFMRFGKMRYNYYNFSWPNASYLYATFTKQNDELWESKRNSEKSVVPLFTSFDTHVRVQGVGTDTMLNANNEWKITWYCWPRALKYKRKHVLSRWREEESMHYERWCCRQEVANDSS